MTPTVTAAIVMMMAALPMMFIVIAIFIFLTKGLFALFPATEEDEM